MHLAHLVGVTYTAYDKTDLEEVRLCNRFKLLLEHLSTRTGESVSQIMIRAGELQESNIGTCRTVTLYFILPLLPFLGGANDVPW